MVPFPSDEDSAGSEPPTKRRLGLILGSVAAVVVVAAGATTAVLLYRSSSENSAEDSAAGGFGTGTPAAVAAQPACTAPPILETESFDLRDEGLVVGAALFSGCPGGDVEAGEAVRVTVADGERDIAAGEFDFSASPVEMKAGVPEHRTLVFPKGMYWRTPDMVSGKPTLVAHRGETRTATPVASTSTTDELVAVGPAEPEHGSVDGVAKAVLNELRDADYPVVLDGGANRWVPQVSSKRAGLVADGRTLSNADVLRDHLDFRQRFDQARLVYSGQWSTFNDSDWWVTVVGPSWVYPEGANGWCDRQGFGVDDCFAKFLSNLFGPERTTVYRK
ncbi:hypothetical protein V4U86_19240 [Mycobacterium sp. AMU20-3851]|uniref:hypothetical protein n=1 Tax=Mycobacterium sp. AMU20-3851 TaxID=3122055 RepID=UPI003753F8E8